jgi:cytochrome c oxidase cbb3-type subunit 3/ubiquinol-cytochrome c reductase cytochrome c subunit
MRRTLVLLLALSAAGCARKNATPTGPLVERGRQAYARLCATCHGPTAQGYAADNSPSLRSPTFLASATDAFLRAGIARGRPGTAMAAFGRALGGPLAPAEVDAIIAFLREGGPPPQPLPPGPVNGDLTQGRVIYQANCARCHGTQTRRSSAIHLANPILLETASFAFLRRAVEAGRPPTSMVPWKGALTPAQIVDVVAYVRSMAVRPGIPAAPPPGARAGTPLLPRTGPVVLNPAGRAADFALKEDRFVSIDLVKKALDEKRRLVIADARAPSDWLNLHIAGAISTPYYDARSLDDIPNDGTWVLAYCACPHHVSGQVVDELRKRGYKHTAVIDEGIFAWQHKGYPIVAAPGLLPSAAPPPPSHR